MRVLISPKLGTTAATLKPWAGLGLTWLPFPQHLLICLPEQREAS